MNCHAAGVAVLSALLALSCQPKDSLPESPSDGGAGAGAGGGGGAGGGTGGAGGGAAVCDEQDLALNLAGVRVMLLVDASSSMRGARWTAASAAIEAMMKDPGNASTAFGLDAFPDSAIPNGCATDGPYAVELGAGKHAAISQWMKDHQPPLLGAATPLVGALEQYLKANSPLRDKDTANYLVVISDGEDTCRSGDGNFERHDKLNLLAGVVHELKTYGTKTIAIGFGDSAPEGELDVIAKNGGSSFNRFIKATNQAELQSALLEISRAVRPCRFQLRDVSTSADPSKVNLYFDTRLVPRDRTRTAGWNWARSERLEVELYGSACAEVKSGTVSKVKATFGCPTRVGPDQKVCGQKDYLLPFPQVAVEVLQDFSGSMNDAKKWESATNALTAMLVDDRNDHLAFGLDLFPDSSACGIDPFPTIPVGSYNNLKIVDHLANHDPTGSTPLLTSMQRVLSTPMKLGEPGVSGVLVVVSDGGESCNSQDIVQNLASTTRELVSRHRIQVFAIGFGSAINAAELNAIAQNGGTGLTSFLRADNQAELDGLYRTISRRVTQCVFDVPHAGLGIDYRDVNFYLDGVAVQHSTTDGWSWVNPSTLTKVQFAGKACEKLRDGTVQDVLVEFGCTTIN